MFFLLSKILDFIVSPLSWIILSLVAGLVIRHPQRKKRLLFTSLFLLLFFTNPVIIRFFLGRWEIKPYSSALITNPYDVGIVMGGSMRFYDQDARRVVYANSVDRLLQALQLYHDGKIKKILLTGGSGFVNFQEWKESGLIAKVLVKSGVKVEDIILENNSRNTYENAVMTSTLLKSGIYGNRYLLITSATHMRRSLACFQKAGIIAVAFPVDPRSGVQMYTPDKLIEPDADNLVSWDVLIHEWVGMLMYKLNGYI